MHRICKTNSMVSASSTFTPVSYMVSAPTPCVGHTSDATDPLEGGNEGEDAVQLLHRAAAWELACFVCLLQQNFLILLMAEIRHQLIGSLSHYLQGFIYHRWCRISSINSMDQLDDAICFSTIGICDVRRNCLEQFQKKHTHTQF